MHAQWDPSRHWPQPAPAATRSAADTAEHLLAPTLAPIDLDELVAGCRRTVVVAPHPDDETLGIGGLLAALLRRHLPLAVILVTDGESGHAATDTPLRAALGRARPLESLLALHELGWARPHVYRLQLPDGDVAAHEHALARRLARLLHADDHVLTTWRYDGDADHEATARAVARVATDKRCACAQFPVWSRTRTLHGDARADGRLRRFALDDAALVRKRRALAAFRTQLTDDPVTGALPVVFPSMVSRFLVPFEVLIL